MYFEFRSIFRNLMANGIYSFIGIAGLTFGVIASLMLMLFVIDQTEFDQNYVAGGPIYTINTHVKLDGSEFTTATGPAPLADVMRNEVSGVTETARMVKHRRVVFKLDNRTYFEDHVFYTQSSLFDFFHYDFVEGRAAGSLDSPKSVVITAGIAKKYFGNTPALGQTINIDDELYKITGVIANPTQKAHFVPRIFISLSTLDPARDTVWASLNDHTYIRLANGADIAVIESSIGPITDKYTKDIYSRFNANLTFMMQPLSKIHFGGVLRETIDASKIGSVSDTYLALIVAILIMLLASANYAILSVAASIKRAKEVSMRKILGATRTQLVFQSFVESIVIVIGVFIFSGFMIFILAPYLPSGFFSEASTDTLFGWQTILAGLGIGLIVGAVCAAYPAWYLSVFEPVIVLKGGSSDNLMPIPFKKILLFIQLCLAFFMLSGMVILYSQYKLVSGVNLGFKPDAVAVVEMSGSDTQQSFTVLQNKLKAVPGITSVASSSAIPGRPGFDSNSFQIQKENGGFELMVITNFRVNQDFATAMNIDVVNGRFFSDKFLTDKDAVIVNEALVKQFGWTNPVGKEMQKIINQDMDKEFYTVIGVVKDFNIHGLNEKVMPMAILYRKVNPFVLINFDDTRERGIARQVAIVWRDAIGNQPFELKYLTDFFADEYRQESNKTVVFASFTVLAIIIAFVGIFGIVSYDVRQRARELALRLILGANGLKITLLLNNDYVKVIGIACLISSLLSFYAMNYYLQMFANRISIDVFAFLPAIIVISSVTFATIFWHVVTVVSKNPRDALGKQ